LTLFTELTDLEEGLIFLIPYKDIAQIIPTISASFYLLKKKLFFSLLLLNLFIWFKKKRILSCSLNESEEMKMESSSYD
jgi:hypothetical protein